MSLFRCSFRTTLWGWGSSSTVVLVILILGSLTIVLCLRWKIIFEGLIRGVSSVSILYDVPSTDVTILCECSRNILRVKGLIGSKCCLMILGRSVWEIWKRLYFPQQLHVQLRLRYAVSLNFIFMSMLESFLLFSWKLTFKLGLREMLRV